MKKIFPFVLALVCCLSLVSCGGDSSDNVQEKENEVDNRQNTEEVEDWEEELSGAEKNDADLRAIVNEYYSSTDVTEIILNENAGTDDEGDYVALVYLTWNVKNKPDMTKQMLAMYSEDFAARVGQDIESITDFAIFWTVPYYSETDTAAKYSYERKDGGMYQTDEMISNIIK